MDLPYLSEDEREQYCGCGAMSICSQIDVLLEKLSKERALNAATGLELHRLDERLQQALARMGG